MIITGDLNGSKLRVYQMFQHQTDSEGNIIEHPNGYYVESIPEYPPAKKGIDYIMYYNIETKELFFEEQIRPLNEIELREEQTEILKEILAVLKNK